MRLITNWRSKPGSLTPREARAWREPERGVPNPNGHLSPPAWPKPIRRGDGLLAIPGSSGLQPCQVMNDPNTPPLIPQTALVGVTAGQTSPSTLGANPEEQTPIPNAVATVESILRQPRRVLYQLRQPGSGRLMVTMIFVAAVCSLVYGVVVGTFSGGTQLWAAPLK